MRYLVPACLALALACGGTPTDTAIPEDAPSVGEVTPGEAAASPPVVRVRPSFPLRVGDRWRWQVTRHVGAGLRVVFIPTEPATTDVISTWELTIDRALPDGRFAATRTRTDVGGLPERADLVLWSQDGDLWMEGPDGPVAALPMPIPPDALAAEKVPCTAVFLDGAAALCSPAPGGPLDVPPGPVDGVAMSDADNGRTIAQVLVGIGTAGLIIPGNRAATDWLELTAWTPAAPPATSPAVERFRANPRAAAVSALLPADREDAAAFVVLAKDEDRTAVTRAVLATATDADRAALLRVDLSARADGRLEELAALIPDLGAPGPASVDSILALLPEADQEAAKAMIAGRWPALRAVVVADGDPGRAAALRAELSRRPVDNTEASAIIARFDDPAAAVGPLLDAAAPADRMALLTAACAGVPWDDDRMRLLEANAALVEANAGDVGRMSAFLDTFSFDDGRRDAVLKLVDAARPAERGPLLRLGIEKMSFESDKLALLEARPEVVSGLSDADRAAVLASFTSEREAAAAKLRR